MPSTSSEGSDSVSETAMMATYALLVLQLVLTIGLNMCYGCIFMYINSAAASRRTLGATNGLAQDERERDARGGPCGGELVVFALA